MSREKTVELTHYTQVDNFSPDVPQKVFQNAISSLITTPQLARYRPDTKFPAPTTFFNKDDIAETNRRQSLLENPIKGLLLRSGFVFLAFHDLRDAIAAKTYFETRQSDVFDSCVDQAKDEIGRKRLTGTFLTMDQVTIVRIALSFPYVCSYSGSLLGTGRIDFSRVNGRFVSTHG